MKSEQLERIGFKYILSRLNTATPYGNDLKKNINIYAKDEKTLLEEEYDYIELILNKIKTNKDFKNDVQLAFQGFKDIKNTIKTLENTSDILDELEIFEIKNFIIASEKLKKVLNLNNIKINKLQIFDLSEALKLLNPESIIFASFKIYDSYSTELAEIRKEKSRLEDLLLKIRDLDKSKELKDERLKIVILEQKEEVKIREKLTVKLREYAKTLKNNIESIARLDLVFAKAVLALEFDGVRPEITYNNILKLDDCFNPEVLMHLRDKNKEVVPISVVLNSGTNIITGANMGGKSVGISTITLNIYLALCGFFVFAKNSSIPMLDFVFFMSADMQSVKQGLSSFGAEIVLIKELLELMNKKQGFVAIDEFAKGTNAYEGRAIVKAFFEYLMKFNTISLLTTHYDGVLNKDMNHYQVMGLKDANFENILNKLNSTSLKTFDVIQEFMDYRLEKVNWDSKVPKEAMKVASMLGFEGEILDRASNLLNMEEENAK